MSAAWHRDIERTRDARQLVSLAREYVATFAPRDLARVPGRCRPGRIAGAADIAAFSVRLAEEYWHLRGTAADVRVLQELWGFFLRASVHLARLNDGGRAGQPQG